MPEIFDPYREWLGIEDGPRPPNHYTLLGLSPQENYPAVIAQAADTRMAMIRRIRPGQNAAEWGRLLDLLGLAKACLLDPAAKGAYDASLTAESCEPCDVPPPVAIPLPPPPPAVIPYRPSPQRIDAPPKEQSMRGLVIAALLAVIVALSGGLYYVATQPQRNPEKVAVAQDTRDGGMTVASDHSRENPPPDANKRQAVTAPPTTPQPKSYETNTKPAQADPPQVEQEKPKPQDVIQPESPAVPETPSAVETPAPFAKPVPVAKPEPKEDPKKRAAFTKAAAEARDAMAKRNLVKAKKLVQVAVESIQTQAEDDEASRLDALERNLEEFWNGMRTAIAKLGPGTEFEYKDTRFVVIESNRNRLAIQMGQRREYDIETIPTPMLAAIAAQCLVQDAGWKMLMGTFLAMDANGNRELAKQLWLKAKREGAPVDVLLPELKSIVAGKEAIATGGADNGGGDSHDGEKLKSQIADIEQRAKRAKAAKEHSEVAKQALQLLQTAVAANRLDELGQLIEIARSASRKSNSPSLMKQAAFAPQQFEAMKKR